MAPVADIEQITEHLDRIALLPFTEQFRDGNAQVLAEQVEQSGLERRHGVNRDTQVECLEASPRRIAVREAASHIVQDAVIAADRLTDDELTRVVECLPNLVAARYFAHSGIARTIFEDDDVAGKEWAVRAT